MKHAFLILASGKSSRFGGFPKAFCKIGDTYVVQKTVDLGLPYFDMTYLVINREIYPDYKDAVLGCKILPIGTGQGDSHSFLRAARLVKEDCGADRITLCWGDTFYFNDVIFKKAAETDLNKFSVGVSLSSIDPEPYAWYEPDGDKIKASHFRAKDGVIENGIHDQSVFIFNLDAICIQLESYMKALGLRDEDDYINKDISKEMKLLDSFTYFYENNLLPMRYSLVESGWSYSFNTKEELEMIRRKAEKAYCDQALLKRRIRREKNYV